MYYLELIAQLNRSKVKYLLIGGIALVLHGVLRLTADVDIMIDMGKENIMKLLEAMKKLGFVPKLPVDPKDLADPATRKEWIKSRNMKVFSFIHKKDDYKLIDILIDVPIEFGKAYKRKKIVKSGNINIDVLSLDDLIELKTASAREQDMEDIRMLKELSKGEGKRK